MKVAENITAVVLALVICAATAFGFYSVVNTATNYAAAAETIREENREEAEERIAARKDELIAAAIGDVG